MYSVTSNAVARAISSNIGTRLRSAYVTAKNILNVASTTDSAFIAQCIAAFGVPCILNFTYAWAGDVKVTFYNGSSSLGTYSLNGQGVLYINGRFASGSWDGCNYVFFGGADQSGTSYYNTIISGFITYNGGTTLTRIAKKL